MHDLFRKILSVYGEVRSFTCSFTLPVSKQYKYIVCIFRKRSEAQMIYNMRKTYSSPFNKFVVFLYGLLSLAVITLSQENGSTDCASNSIVSSKRQVTMGYVQYFTNQPSIIHPKKIRWDFYDYINVIGKEKKNLSFRIN